MEVPCVVRTSSPGCFMLKLSPAQNIGEFAIGPDYLRGGLESELVVEREEGVVKVELLGSGGQEAISLRTSHHRRQLLPSHGKTRDFIVSAD